MKLSEKQITLLSAALRRADKIVVTSNADAKAAIIPLLKAKLLEEIPTQESKLSWRRDKHNQLFALRVAETGLKAIHVAKETSSDASRSSALLKSKTPRPSHQPIKSASRRQNVATRKSAVPKVRKGSVREKLLRLLQKPQGVTLDALVKSTGWQRHSVRGFLAGTVRGKLKLSLVSEEIKGVRTYRIGGKRSSAPVARRAA